MAQGPHTPPKQHQDVQPGREGPMHPKPRERARDYRGSGKLEGKSALITGGDSGIGRSVAILFAREGADVAIVYLEEDEDANETRRLVEQEGRRCLALRGDVADASFCEQAVAQTVGQFGKLDVLVNNAAEQHPCDSFEEITLEQWDRTFRTNIYGYFHMVRAAIGHLGDGSAIINTTSVTAYEGNPTLIDYSSTKGAIVSFTRALSNALVGRGIRVNAVAPGPIWTPLIPATFAPEKVESFGKSVPMQRPGEPEEVAPCYVFLASGDASFMSGQTLHPNGGKVVNG
ncbi:MAG TPA: SDR family oxidoreductase [Arenibaculum sp.]|nr:SDR family oxidoreductase [Arenibaculum sp.]